MSAPTPVLDDGGPTAESTLADPLTLVLVVVAGVTLVVLREIPEGSAIAAIVRPARSD